jgi:hypothetical protein
MIPIDKILHFFAGYAIADLAYHLHPAFGGMYNGTVWVEVSRSDN